MQELSVYEEHTNNFFQTAVAMSKFNNEKTENESANISNSERVGDILRNAREKSGFELKDIHQQTRISYSNLAAMEDGRYNDLPALSFCRGFYKIYAEFIGLDANRVVTDFQKEWSDSPRKKQIPFFSFENKNEEIDTMAGRPSLLAFSSIGLLLLLLTFFTAFLCWFFAWNPASFLSQKLRSFDHTPTLEERFSPTPDMTSSMAFFKSSSDNNLQILRPSLSVIKNKGYSKTDFQNATILLTPHPKAKPFNYLIASVRNPSTSLKEYPPDYLSQSFVQHLTDSLYR